MTVSSSCCAKGSRCAPRKVQSQPRIRHPTLNPQDGENSKHTSLLHGIYKVPDETSLEYDACIMARRESLTHFLDAYRCTRPLEETIPENADIFNMPPFTALLEAPTQNFILDPKAVKKLLEQLPALSLQWKEEKSRFLLSLLPSPGKTEADLQLATTLFQCFGCQVPISYPRILSHRCMTAPDERPEVLESRPGSWRGNCRMSMMPWNFGNNRVTYHVQAARAAADILKMCGMDPLTTTSEQMEKRNVRFACKCLQPAICLRKLDTFAIWNWRAAIEHSAPSWTDSSRHAVWKVVDGDAEEFHSKLIEEWNWPEEKLLWPRRRKIERNWGCALCRAFCGTVPEVQNHFAVEHEIDQNIDDVERYIYKHLDTNISRHSFGVVELGRMK